MKVLGLFVLCFGVLSVLPFLWNQFQFVEFGFPFVYMQRSIYEGSDYAQQAYIFQNLNLVYDLIIVAIAVWALTKIRPAAKNSV
jgi:hypothetical protein